MKIQVHLISILLLSATLFAGKFELVNIGETEKVVSFHNNEDVTQIVDNYLHFLNPEKGTTIDEGMPQLPIHTTFFQMKNGISYTVDYTIISSHLVSDVEIYPYQGEPESDVNIAFKKNELFYNSNLIYPEFNLTVSEPMTMRDIEVGLITFVPYEYNTKSKTLTVYDEVEINIVESGVREINTDLPPKRSLLFEPFYHDLIVDYLPLSSHDEYQASSILYICGGNSYSHPYVQQLVEWRKKQGYIVYLAPSNQTGSSTSSISNYIDDAYLNWENPPEIVGLIGDVDGTYGLSTFTSNGDGDNEYTYINGNDYLPEIFIGRISVESSSDLSNIINKTLTYEKAENQIDAWFERAALVGDPNTSSGISPVTTNQYIEYIMENFGMDDIRTNYGNGNYNNWVDNQFSDGVLYYNYRGYYGSSSISPSGTNSGIYAPFACTITCGTGDFGWGTSDSESFIRQGSVTDPKGAVACIGVSTTGTHTMYNNIVDMGIFEGIFSKGMYNAGAALANGKLALLKTYPTNSSAISNFSQWTNLMGDPALHLWTGKPHDFIFDAPSSLPVGVQNMEVSVTDEMGIPVEDARITLILAGQYFSAFTDQSGDAILTWISNSNGEAIITAFKNDFRLAETTITIGQVAGPALYLDQTRTLMDDSIYGDGNMQLNPGETVNLLIPILNFGSEDAHNLTIELVSENVKVTIDSNTQSIILIPSNSSVDINSTFSLDHTAFEGEVLDFKLIISDSNSETWVISVPSYVYGPKLELSGYEVVGSDMLEPGVEAQIDLLFINSGSRDIENLEIILESENDLIGTINGVSNISSIPAGSQVVIGSFTINPVDFMINGSTVSLGYNFTSDSGFEGSDYITFSVGQRDEGDPLGPDEYGYYIYDSGDVAYPLAPEYEWIEIVGNGGSSFNFNDGGYGEPETGGTLIHSQVIQLPFTFQFYGIQYDEITVNSNGWVSFGNHPMAAFRNYSIPGAGGPSPMVAAFWDDLTTDGSGQVYRLSTDDFVIIQWNDMRIDTYGTTTNTFQMIIYNQAYLGYVTPTGDGEIKVQYKEFHNISNNTGGYYHHANYATIGTENHFGNVGLEYTFNNQNPLEAMELSNETAIYITTSLGFTYTLGDVNQDDELNVLDVVTIVNFILGILEPTPYQQYSGDMNDDNNINILDVVLLTNIILRN